MRYLDIHPGIFQARPNRFIAHIEIDGSLEICHVKNTGRCKELLQPGVTVYCEKSSNPARKTRYDLIAVEKQVPYQKAPLLINMDSQAPNRVVQEWLQAGGLFKDIALLKPECKYKDSRFDFYLETPSKKVFLEVKGVTLEDNRVLRFPDAPTERGVKHVQELCHCLKEGYEAYIVFVIQMNQAKYFTPNNQTHPAFGQALKEAADQGVKVLAYTCEVTPTTLQLAKPVELRL